jgi:hypothetical protein
MKKEVHIMENKRAFEMSFNWIFAFIAGGIILFLAIYGVGRFVQTSGNIANTEAAVQISALLDPLETGLASGKSQEINFGNEVKTFYTCNYLDNKPFGKQTIAFSEKNLKNEYSEKGDEISVKNKYVFAEDFVEGKSMNVFSKPFFMPFKTADLIVIFSRDYCFYQPPNEIKKEIENLNLGKIKITNDLKNCTGIVVCFESERAECDIKVFGTSGNFESGKIFKNNREFYYKNGLIYGAIFSSYDIYECNIKRLTGRLNELAKIYSDKTDIIYKKGCTSSAKEELKILSDSAKAVNSSMDLISLSETGDKIDSINKALLQECKIY